MNLIFKKLIFTCSLVCLISSLGNNATLNDKEIIDKKIAIAKQIINLENAAIKRRIEFSEQKLKQFLDTNYLQVLKNSLEINAGDRIKFYLMRISSDNARIVLHEFALANAGAKYLREHVFKRYLESIIENINKEEQDFINISSLTIDDNNSDNNDDIINDNFEQQQHQELIKFKQDIIHDVNLVTKFIEVEMRRRVITQMGVYYEDASLVCCNAEALLENNRLKSGDDLSKFKELFIRRFNYSMEKLKELTQEINDSFNSISTNSKQLLDSYLQIQTNNLDLLAKQTAQEMLTKSGFAPIIAGYLFQTSAQLLPASVYQRDELDFVKTMRRLYDKLNDNQSSNVKRNSFDLEMILFDFLDLTCGSTEDETTTTTTTTTVTTLQEDNKNKDQQEERKDDNLTATNFRRDMKELARNSDRIDKHFIMMFVSTMRRLQSPSLHAELASSSKQKQIEIDRRKLISDLWSSYITSELFKFNAMNRITALTNNAVVAKTAIDLNSKSNLESIIKVPFNDKHMFALVVDLLHSFIISCSFEENKIWPFNQESLGKQIEKTEKKFFNLKDKNNSKQEKMPESRRLFKELYRASRWQDNQRQVMSIYYKIIISQREKSMSESYFCALDKRSFEYVMLHYIGFNSRSISEIEFGFDLLQSELMKLTRGELDRTRDKLDEIALTVHLWRRAEYPDSEQLITS